MYGFHVNPQPLIVMALALAGCAGGGPFIGPEVQHLALPDSIELVRTPFFPQEDFQCGPAALATVLTDSGVTVVPEDLIGQVYIPGRRGSLQIELLAATRSLGRLPYVIEPELGALIAEVAAGRPVLVLQNLGFGFAPVWHYAAVAGYDAATDDFILRSGTVERKLMPASKFVRSWIAGDNWAMVALRPGELPARPVQANYLRAAAALEASGRAEAARAAFRAAVAYWPESSAALFGLANAYYAAGDLVRAEQTYRLSLAQIPGDAAVRNNLAQVLLDQERCAEALEAIDRAVAEPDPPSALRHALADSRATIRSRCPGRRSSNQPADRTGS